MSDYQFLGMARTTWLGVIATLLVVNLTLGGYVLLRVVQLAQEGAQAHTAECQYKHSIVVQVDQSRLYLRETVAERTHRYEKQYGPKLATFLATIPNTTVRSALVREEAVLQSLHVLRCPTGSTG